MQHSRMPLRHSRRVKHTKGRPASCRQKHGIQDSPLLAATATAWVEGMHKSNRGEADDALLWEAFAGFNEQFRPQVVGHMLQRRLL